jgi:hypothetical protein
MQDRVRKKVYKHIVIEEAEKLIYLEANNVKKV